MMILRNVSFTPAWKWLSVVVRSLWKMPTSISKRRLMLNNWSDRF
ncbi:MAG: hypothetical protein V7K83_09525 [Nostoc sp.]